MGLPARHQRRGRRDQAHIVRRNVAGEVDHAARQRHRAQPRQATRVRLGLGEIEQADAGRLQQHLHEQRLRGGREHERIDAAFEEPDHRRRLRLADQGDGRRVDPVRFHQARRQVGNAAAGGADVDAPSRQLRQARQLARLQQALGRIDPVEQPHRLVEQAAERDEAVVGDVALVAGGGRRFLRAALNESDVDIAAGLAKKRDVLRRAGGLAQAHLDAVFLEDLRVALAHRCIGALILAGGEDDVARRRRVEQPVGQREQADREKDERHRRRDEVAEREQGDADVVAHGGDCPCCGGAKSAAILPSLCDSSSSKTIA